MGKALGMYRKRFLYEKVLLHIFEWVWGSLHLHLLLCSSLIPDLVSFSADRLAECNVVLCRVGAILHRNKLSWTILSNRSLNDTDTRILHRMVVAWRFWIVVLLFINHFRICWFYIWISVCSGNYIDQYILYILFLNITSHIFCHYLVFCIHFTGLLMTIIISSNLFIQLFDFLSFP